MLLLLLPLLLMAMAVVVCDGVVVADGDDDDDDDDAVVVAAATYCLCCLLVIFGLFVCVLRLRVFLRRIVGSWCLRPGERFRHVLNFLRCSSLPSFGEAWRYEESMEEADFFAIDELREVRAGISRCQFVRAVLGSGEAGGVVS